MQRPLLRFCRQILPHPGGLELLAVLSEGLSEPHPIQIQEGDDQGLQVVPFPPAKIDALMNDTAGVNKNAS